MSPAFILLLQLLASSATLGKYVYVKDGFEWLTAQTHCLRIYTDLAPVSNEHDMTELQQKGDPKKYIWIGLRRSPNNRDVWLWPGGEKVSRFFWERGELQNRSDEDFGLIHGDKWYDSHDEPHPFFCYSVIVVRETKQWEAALEYCREHHGDLASVASETEMLLIKKELLNSGITGPVWIGLRFLSGTWLWVDGQPYLHKAWEDDMEPSCPPYNKHCGALQTHTDVYKAHNCEDQLPFICY
ncbi:lymphocyte antigen 75-like [Thalassophryne amazonica]|uniref:lymphocyte antigen 75-like n=1 Tax=Thalassophryne amazonica TaxID=390379 RepID=UPI0014711676|nr:lymphocyte antigen 75-like [Thalassophryne amazonica]